MPNGLGAVLAALAGGAKSYTNLKQREREEALEAERRAREEQDRQEQKAFQQFAMERELRNMDGWYTDEMGPGTLNPDAPSLVKMDRVEAALPGTETTIGNRVLPPLKVNLTPMKAALGIEPDKERLRKVRQSIEVPGSGGRRVYLSTANELSNQDFARRQLEGKIEYENKINQDKVERDTIYKENMARADEEWTRTAKLLSDYGLNDSDIAGFRVGLRPLSAEQKSQERKTKVEAMTNFFNSYRQGTNGANPSPEEVMYFIRSLQSAQDGGKLLTGPPPSKATSPFYNWRP